MPKVKKPFSSRDWSYITLRGQRAPVGSWGEGCILTEIFDCRICHEGAAANVDFKLCRSSLDDHTTCWKAETSSSEAKIVRILEESLKIFPSRPEKGANGLSSFALKGKIEQQIGISARKRPRGPGLSKRQCPALTSSIESYDKYLKPPQKRRNRPNGQQKPGKVSSFT